MRPERAYQFDTGLTPACLNARFEGAEAEDVLHTALRLYCGEVAMVSSFGAEAAVLLHMAARINPHVPVLLVDTLMLFPETLQYQQELGRWLGLTDVRRITPDAVDLQAGDRYDALHMSDADACCALRKTRPLEAALQSFGATVSGRKRYQSNTRSALEFFEVDRAGRIKVNPLAHWDAQAVQAYADTHALPSHPLVKQGFSSIGCAPCTRAIRPGDDPRSGRWPGQDKTECGIHGKPGGAPERRVV